MTTKFSIAEHIIHIWQVFLPDFYQDESQLLALLNPDEIKRANRFHFPEHRIRFLTARGMLRKILALYSQQPPASITFAYLHRGKPSLENNPSQIQFNVSHSFEMAVYAFTQRYPIGVDIEKIEDKDQLELAKRFFSPQEFQELQQMPELERKPAFYTIWSRKEAVIKTSGEGLHLPLESFSVSAKAKLEQISFVHEGKSFNYHLENFPVPQGYQAAFATEQEVKQLAFWQWTKWGIVPIS